MIYVADKTVTLLMAVSMVFTMMAFWAQVSGLSMFFLIGMLLGLFFPVIVILYYMLIGRRFPVTAIVFPKRKDGFAVEISNAGRFTEKRTRQAFYKLRGFKGGNIKPADLGNVIETRRGLMALLYMPSPDEIAPIAGIDEGKLQVVDEDMKFWLASETERAYGRWAAKPSKLMQMLPVISVAVLGITMAIILWVNASYNSAVTQQMSSAAGTLADAVSSLKGAIGSAPGIIK